MSYCHLGRPLIPPYFKSSKKTSYFKPSHKTLLQIPRNHYFRPPAKPQKTMFQSQETLLKNPQKTLFQSQIANPKN